jgi:hypothetical protein
MRGKPLKYLNDFTTLDFITTCMILKCIFFLTLLKDSMLAVSLEIVKRLDSYCIVLYMATFYVPERRLL